MPPSDSHDRLLATLAAAWQSHPRLRLGQLLHLVVEPATMCTELFQMEDNDLLERMGRLARVGRLPTDDPEHPLEPTP